MVDIKLEQVAEEISDIAVAEHLALRNFSGAAQILEQRGDLRGANLFYRIGLKYHERSREVASAKLCSEGYKRTERT